ncbi:MAG TPA: rod shape-determining protein MreD [Patescibacteria group bacterium]|jgi:rod shape-determining protein MreD|nr:rod shape-determining protein MreD [Patescibacteria group bacterium]
MSLGFYLVIPLMIVLTIVQSTLLPQFPILGATPQLWLIATIAWALLRGWQEGIIWAFVAGIFVDLFSAAPLGVTSLALMAAVGVVVFLQHHLPEYRVVIPVILTVIGTLVFWLVYLILLRIIMPIMIEQIQFLGISQLVSGTRATDLMADITQGYAFRGSLLSHVLTTAFLHSLLVLPLYWGLSKLEQMFRPKQVDL